MLPPRLRSFAFLAAKLVPTDPTAIPESFEAVPDSNMRTLAPNNQPVIYALPTAWTKTGFNYGQIEVVEMEKITTDSITARLGGALEAWTFFGQCFGAGEQSNLKCAILQRPSRYFFTLKPACFAQTVVAPY